MSIDPSKGSRVNGEEFERVTRDVEYRRMQAEKADKRTGKPFVPDPTWGKNGSKQLKPKQKGRAGFNKANRNTYLDIAVKIGCPELAVMTLLHAEWSFQRVRGKEWFQFPSERLNELGVARHQKMRFLRKLKEEGIIDLRVEPRQSPWIYVLADLEG